MVPKLEIPKNVSFSKNREEIALESISKSFETDFRESILRPRVILSTKITVAGSEMIFIKFSNGFQSGNSCWPLSKLIFYCYVFENDEKLANKLHKYSSCNKAS